MPKRSLRDAILGSKDFRIRPVDVPEWPVPVHVRSMNILEVLAFEAGKEAVPDEKFVAFYAAWTLCDEDGERIFDPETDVDALCEKDPDVITRIFKEAMSLNMTDKEADAKREGNSEPSPS
jgi:hypothetical protein